MAYSRNCNGCGKAITIGFDSSLHRWRPWDDYEGGINHQCGGAGKKLQQQSINIKDNSELLDKLDSIKNNQASMTCMLQKIAAKIGVETRSVQS